MNLVPRFGNLKIKDIERRDIAGFHRDMRKSPYQANRILGILSKFFNWCELHGLRADNSNPCRHIKRYLERKRERYLSGEDFGRIGDAIKREEGNGMISLDAANAIQLLMLTGARCSEIRTLKWEYIDWEKGLALLPDSKTGQKPLYLSGPALQILEGIPRRPGNAYVIAGQKTGTCMTDLKRPWRIVCNSAGLANLRLHDLRHSFASAAVCRGLSLPMIGKLLGHRSTQTTARYAHLADNPVMEANEVVGDQIAKAMGMLRQQDPLPENVVRLSNHQRGAGDNY